jgi:hypothetical protein
MPALNISCAKPSVSYPVSVSFSSKPSPSAKATWSYGGSTPAYSYGGNTFNSSGYLANPSRSAQIEARDAGALTNYEARQMGLPNRR